MATIGNGDKPAGGFHAFGGSSQTNQEAELLSMPTNGTIHSVGCWIGGWEAACDVWLTVWSADAGRARLGQSNMLTVANEGAAGPGGSNVKLYVADLLTPVDLAKDADFYVGFIRKQNDAHQISTGSSGSGPHFHGRSGAGQQNAAFAVAGYSSEPLRIGAYVANYVPRPGAWIYRSGSWQQSDTVSAYRSGSWQEIDTVSVRRGAAWIEAD